MAQLIRTDGTVAEITPKNGKAFTLEEMQGYVGGWIEIVPTKDGKLLVLDEEGKLKGLPLNRWATTLYRYGHADPIVGTVIHCTSTEAGDDEEEE